MFFLSKQLLTRKQNNELERVFCAADFQADDFFQIGFPNFACEVVFHVNHLALTSTD